MLRILVLCSLMLFFFANPLFAQKKNKSKPQDKWTEGTFQGLKFRSVGPALTSGRIGDIAVHPEKRHVYYVAVSSGGVWKTINNGTTWQPIFDTQGSYSIGCITLDPNNPYTVWVGSGENNSQRSVSYGDGVYKSVDGGKNWKNMGLKNSEHIGEIVVDPRNSDVVFVAAQGPLWNAGGDRGLYKSTDGGENWKKVLNVSPHTGVSDIVYDPRNPDVMVASTYQRRRRVWTLINGGPESAIYKSTDGGESWRKIKTGLPSVDMGRIGLAISPANPDVLYAIIEAADGKGGFFKSTDRGESWKKMNKYVSGSPQYYQELVPDPQDVNRVYSLDTWLHVTTDGGKTMKKVGGKFKHVDDHALWIDPKDPEYLLIGCDGGVYESFDRGATWHFKANLPVTQFYRVAVDNEEPFYNIYGGTQDNFTLGGPSQTTNIQGITNQDWYVTLGGDGFEPAIDPTDPNIVYSQYQYGGLVRYDKKSGETLFIRPQAAKGEAPLRWNWDSALLISPHNHKRIFFAAQKVFRSDDRGATWTAISPDLTRDLDRNQLQVMGKIQRVDAVAKNKSTSFYGTIVSLDESPLQEGLMYSGSDDGLIQVTEDGGKNWKRVDRFPGIKGMPYVSDVLASRHQANVVYAALDAHKDGDFKPYVLKSSNRGTSWVSISGNLPQRGTVYSLMEDHENPNLLFAGTEFGVFFTVDGGKRWVQLKGGIPVIAVRDLDIQRREDDLVAGTFGRGFYVLDDYSMLRNMSPASLEQEAQLFAVKDALAYMPDAPLGLPDKSFQGDSYYTAPNPPFGAVFTYYLRDGLKTLKQQRQAREKKNAGAKYPGWDELRAEDREKKPEVILTVKDEAGNIVRTMSGPVGKGFHRVAWDLRYPPLNPTDIKPASNDNPFRSKPTGPLAVPGKYTVEMMKRVNGQETSLGSAQPFTVTSLGLATLPAEDKAALLAFQQKTARLQRAILGANMLVGEASSRLAHIRKAIQYTNARGADWVSRTDKLSNDLKDIQRLLQGDRTISRRSEPAPMSISRRMGEIIQAQWSSSSAPTQTSKTAYDIAADEFAAVLPQLKKLITVDLKKLEDDLEIAGAPFTPGRFPVWEKE